MRIPSMVVVAALLAVAPAAAQTPAPAAEVYTLDPYDPSDAELLRKYGSVLVAQTPILELRKLDPHTPSHAALLRDLGGAIPLWGLWYPPTPLAAPLTPFPESARVGPAPATNIFFVFTGQPAQADAASSTPGPAAAAAPPGPESASGAVTLLQPETNDGVWISYAGQKWISAGPALPLDESAYSRVGEHGGFPVFKRQGGQDDVIYLLTGDDAESVAPYRIKP
jgi:hypothetical protein